MKWVVKTAGEAYEVDATDADEAMQRAIIEHSPEVGDFISAHPHGSHDLIGETWYGLTEFVFEELEKLGKMRISRGADGKPTRWQLIGPKWESKPPTPKHHRLDVSATTPKILPGRIGELIGPLATVYDQQLWMWKYLKHRSRAYHKEDDIIKACNMILTGVMSTRDVASESGYNLSVITHLFPHLDAMHRARFGTPILCQCGTPVADHKGLCDYRRGMNGSESRTQDGKFAGKNPDAVALGGLGGLVGGHAAAKAMTPEQRQARAVKAAAARWGKPRQIQKISPPDVSKAQPIVPEKALVVSPEPIIVSSPRPHGVNAPHMRKDTNDPKTTESWKNLPRVGDIRTIPTGVSGRPRVRGIKRGQRELNEEAKHTPGFRRLEGREDVCSECHAVGFHYGNCASRFRR